MRLSGGESAFKRGPVHPCHHHHAPGRVFLDDRGDEAVGIKFQFVEKAHDHR